MSETFLYTVKPRKTIMGLSGTTKVLRTNKSLYLTKEDVYLCLKHATVYRRFANEGFNERVTINDVERVHRENYIAPDKWEAFCAAEKSKEQGTVKVVETPKVEKPAVEPKVESTHVENKVEEVAVEMPVEDTTEKEIEEAQHVEDVVVVSDDEDFVKPE